MVKQIATLKQALDSAREISALRKEIYFVPLMGPNGAGKNKKGRIICDLGQSIGTYRIVMSDVIKQHRRRKTPLGIQFEQEQGIEDGGGLLSDAPVISAFEEEVLNTFELHKSVQDGHTCRIVLDGFPRNPAQMKRFMSYRVPYTIFAINIGEATCLERVDHRAKMEGPRSDDASAPDRFRLLTRNIGEMTRMAKRSNPHSVILINGILPVRDQIMRILKRTFSPRDVLRMAKRLDNRTDSARSLMDEVEGKKYHGATAHSIPGAQTGWHEQREPSVSSAQLATA